MVVFAGAGVDSSLKHLIRDAVPDLIRFDAAAREEMRSFAKRRLSANSEGRERPGGYDLLADLLVAPRGARRELVRFHIRDLIASSLQSKAEFCKAVKALGSDPARLSIDLDALDEAFKMRNKIIHELDVDLARSPRVRISRRRDPMIEAANTLLAAADTVLSAVDRKLAEYEASLEA